MYTDDNYSATIAPLRWYADPDAPPDTCYLADARIACAATPDVLSLIPPVPDAQYALRRDPDYNNGFRPFYRGPGETEFDIMIKGSIILGFSSPSIWASSCVAHWQKHGDILAGEWLKQVDELKAQRRAAVDRLLERIQYADDASIRGTSKELIALMRSANTAAP